MGAWQRTTTNPTKQSKTRRPAPDKATTFISIVSAPAWKAGMAGCGCAVGTMEEDEELPVGVARTFSAAEAAAAATSEVDSPIAVADSVAAFPASLAACSTVAPAC